MNYLNKIRLAVSALALSAAPAFAEFYVGAQYSAGKTDATDLSIDMDTFGLTAGYKINDYISIEGKYWAVDETVDWIEPMGIGAELKVDSLQGVYGKFSLPTDADFSPYLILGYSEVDFKATATHIETGFSASAKEGDSGTSVGIGLDGKLNDNISLTLEYAKLVDEDAYSVNLTSIGLLYRF